MQGIPNVIRIQTMPLCFHPVLILHYIIYSRDNLHIMDDQFLIPVATQSRVIGSTSNLRVGKPKVPTTNTTTTTPATITTPIPTTSTTPSPSLSPSPSPPTNTVKTIRLVDQQVKPLYSSSAPSIIRSLSTRDINLHNNSNNNNNNNNNKEREANINEEEGGQNSFQSNLMQKYAIATQEEQETDNHNRDNSNNNTTSTNNKNTNTNTNQENQNQSETNEEVGSSIFTIPRRKTRRGFLSTDQDELWRLIQEHGSQESPP